MFLYLRYNRWAQVALLVVVIGTGVGGYTFYNTLHPSTAVEATDATESGTSSATQEPTVEPAGEKIGEHTYQSGSVKILGFVAGETRPTTKTDLTNDLLALKGGYALNQRGIKLPDTIANSIYLHGQSLVELVEMYTKAAEVKGYKVNVVGAYSDITAKRLIKDIRFAAVVNLGLERRTGDDPREGGIRIIGPRYTDETQTSELPGIVDITTKKLAKRATDGEPTNGPLKSDPAAPDATPTKRAIPTNGEYKEDPTAPDKVKPVPLPKPAATTAATKPAAPTTKPVTTTTKPAAAATKPATTTTTAPPKK